MTEEGPIGKTETFVKRLLERLGSTVDVKLSPSEREGGLSLGEIGHISSLIENEIESSLRPGGDGSNPIAPNQFKVLFTYEQRSRLSDRYAQALAQELKATASEFILNRRYKAAGPISLQICSDVFSKSTAVKVAFGEEGSSDEGTDVASAKPVEPKEIELASGDGPRFHLRCFPDVPLYVGRAAGCSVHIDDPSISRLHCSIALRTAGDIVLSDLGSSNGTSVNGRIVSSGEARLIERGDTIQIGDVKLEVV